MIFYCPSCGEWSEIDNDIAESIIVAPGEVRMTCPDCGTVWRVKIEFEEVEA